MNKPTEPSAAEVERVIAEQMANLPRWWSSAERKQGQCKASRAERDRQYRQRRKLRGRGK